MQSGEQMEKALKTGLTPLSAGGFEGVSRPKNFRLAFSATVIQLKATSGVWVEPHRTKRKAMTSGAWAQGASRRRVRELARKMARARVRQAKVELDPLAPRPALDFSKGVRGKHYDRTEA